MTTEERVAVIEARCKRLQTGMIVLGVALAGAIAAIVVLTRPASTLRADHIVIGSGDTVTTIGQDGIHLSLGDYSTWLSPSTLSMTWISSNKTRYRGSYGATGVRLGTPFDPKERPEGTYISLDQIDPSLRIYRNATSVAITPTATTPPPPPPKP